MRIPYVIDNQQRRLADVLNEVLAEHAGRSLDVATAYFTVGGYGLVRERLSDVGSFRLLLGAEPTQGEQVGLRPDAARAPLSSWNSGTCASGKRAAISRTS